LACIYVAVSAKLQVCLRVSKAVDIAVGPQRGRCDLRGGDCYDQVTDWDSIRSGE
jgi:hypothetical protein